MTNPINRIRHLQAKREFYRRLGKLKRLHMIDAELVPLMTEQVRQENLVETVRRDIELIAGDVTQNGRKVA